MPWNSTFPDGSKSVKANETQGQDNTTYIQNTMGNSVEGTNLDTTRDHYWNVDPTLDGRHRFIQSPAFTVGGLPTDPVVGLNMDSVAYSKQKTATESPAQQDVQPYFRNDTDIMQVLGIRACAVFDVQQVNPFAVTMKYAHNIASVVRDDTGEFTVTYTTALPSNAYLVLGGAIRSHADSDRELLLEVQSGLTIDSVKSTTRVKVMSKSDGGSLIDPLQAWLICFGG